MYGIRYFIILTCSLLIIGYNKLSNLKIGNILNESKLTVVK